MKKTIIFIAIAILSTTLGFSQKRNYWTNHSDATSIISKDKGVARVTFPKEFMLFDLNIEQLRQDLFSVVDNQYSKHSVIITLPKDRKSVV